MLSDRQIETYRKLLAESKSKLPFRDNAREDDHIYLRGLNGGIDLALMLLDKVREMPE